MEEIKIGNSTENLLLKSYNAKISLKEMAVYIVATVLTAVVSRNFIKEGIVVQLAGILIVLYYFRILVKEKRIENFREEIKNRNLSEKDLQELTNLTRKRSTDSKNLPSKFMAGLGVIVLPGYSWFVVEILKLYFSGDLQGKFLLIFGTASAFVLVFVIWLTTVVEQFSQNYQYKEIAEILEGIQIDRLVEKYPKGTGTVTTPGHTTPPAIKESL